MEFKFKIKRMLKTSPDIFEKKINAYFKTNCYRIVERGLGYVIFVDDEFSDRKVSKSDFYKRIGKGKFEFSYSGEHETSVRLIYFTSVSYLAFLVMLFSAFGIYTSNIIMPVFMSSAFTIPVLFRIIYLNENVFNNIMEC